MVSLITDKLRRQILKDDVIDKDDALLQREMGEGMRKRNETLALNAPHESQPHISSDHCASPPHPHPSGVQRREEEEACCLDEASSSDRCRLCFQSDLLRLPTKKRQSHVMLSPDDTDGATWRPDWQATSIWRPVGLRNPTPGFPTPGFPTPGFPTPGFSAPIKMAAAVPTSEAFYLSDYGDGASRRLSTSSESPSPVLRPASASSGFFENYAGPSHAGSRWWVCSKQSPSLNLSAFSLTSGLSSNDAASSVGRGVPGSTGSMPAIGVIDACSGSVGFGQPQRCHSQPSVLLERRGVKKRRREERRPNLNFIKMKETAYSKRHQVAHSRARNHVQFVENPNFLQVAKSDSGGDQSRFFYSLDTIASSPQELVFCQASVSPTGGAATPLQSAGGDSDPGGEGGAYRESLDSGCSGDFVPCFDSESPNPDLESRSKKQLNMGIEEEEEVFDLDVLDDLDIEEIEKD